MSIQDNLKHIRRFLNMKQSDMANVASMSLSNYGKVERGEIRLSKEKETLICKLLNINPLDAEKLNDPSYNPFFKKKNSKKKGIHKKMKKAIHKLENIVKNHFKTNEGRINVCKTCNKQYNNDLDTNETSL